MLSFCDCFVFSFFVFRLIIICEECPSTIRFTRTEIRRLNDRRGDSTSCTLLLKTIMDILPPLLKNKMKLLILIYLNAFYLILGDFVTLLRVSSIGRYIPSLTPSPRPSPICLGTLLLLLYYIFI